MAIPIYLFLQDDGGADIRGAVDVTGREGSIEVFGLNHCLSIPTDSATGKITGTRIHGPMGFDKETDCSSPYLYEAVSSGRTLKRAEFRYYQINDAGQEQEYFKVTLENVKFINVMPIMHDIKSSIGERHNHIEYVDLRYEKITWHYLDGNISHSDSWNERITA